MSRRGKRGRPAHKGLHVEKTPVPPAKSWIFLCAESNQGELEQWDISDSLTTDGSSKKEKKTHYWGRNSIKAGLFFTGYFIPNGKEPGRHNNMILAQVLGFLSLHFFRPGKI